MTPRRPPPAAKPPRLSLSVQYALAATTLPVAATLRRWARAALERDAAVTMRFVGTREGTRLNGVFRGQDHATNVLTFVYDDATPLAGDIVLCAPVVRREAREQGKAFEAHCAHLVVHGMLHLQGYEHETDREAAAMEARETAILRTLSVADPYTPTPAARPRAAARA